ncbi:MAG: adenylosuccinate lyase [Candidatus Anstonellales archaeon]
MPTCPFEDRYRTDMNELFEKKHIINTWMKVELALARANAKLGLIPKDAPADIAKAMESVSIEEIEKVESDIHHDLMAMVNVLSSKCKKYGGFVHLGATSYDIEDTATALIFRDAISLLQRRLETLKKILKKLAIRHKKTVCVGRTHGQHAVPTTYGMKFALYYQELKRHMDRLTWANHRIAVGKMSGAVGTMATFGEYGPQIQSLVCKELNLREAVITNQVIQRDSHSEVLFVLALIGTTLEKIAKEIRNLQRTEIGEVLEPFSEKQVGSSTMPQKRNPHKSERICSLARILRANLQVALENVPLEHERDLTNSANERYIFPSSFITLDYMLLQMCSILEGLQINVDAINRNLELTRGLFLAERVMMALTKKGMGRQEAHELVRKCAQEAYKKNIHLKTALEADPKCMELLSSSELSSLFDPSTYIGKAEEIIDKALAD